MEVSGTTRRGLSKETEAAACLPSCTKCSFGNVYVCGSFKIHFFCSNTSTMFGTNSNRASKTLTGINELSISTVLKLVWGGFWSWLIVQLLLSTCRLSLWLKTEKNSPICKYVLVEMKHSYDYHHAYFTFFFLLLFFAASNYVSCLRVFTLFSSTAQKLPRPLRAEL